MSKAHLCHVNITETSPCAIGDFHKWLLYKSFMSLSIIVIQIHIKFLEITVTWTNIWLKLTLITLEIPITHIIDYFYFTPQTPFLLYKWGFEGSVSHRVVSIMKLKFS